MTISFIRKRMPSNQPRFPLNLKIGGRDAGSNFISIDCKRSGGKPALSKLNLNRFVGIEKG